MISVLIPTYNYNAFPLVKKIHDQLEKENIPFEIICLDDASNSEKNKQNENINLLVNATFKILSKNIGRSTIRNLLAQKAIYPWLLFLDADVLPKTTYFINKYLHAIKEDLLCVFCGGVSYEDNSDDKDFLRFKYGKIHEEISKNKKNKKPFKYFFTANFLIRKETFISIFFEEKLNQYGKEDLLFSLQLRKKGYNIKHVNNTVLHLGIDNNEDFVTKTKQAMENMMYLWKEKQIETKESSLLKVVSILLKLKIAISIGKFHKYLEQKAIKKSSVLLLHCTKISYLCFLTQNHKTSL